MTTAPPPVSLLRHGDFLRLWAAETISQFGTQVTNLALPLVAILLLSADSLQVGVIDAFQSLPFLLLALPAGAWIDRMRRRPILIVSDLGRAICLASIPLAYALGVLSMPQLWVVAFLLGGFLVFFGVSYQTYLPSLIGEAKLVDGSSKLEISRSAAAIAGPGIGGVLVATIGSPFAIAVDALSYLGSAAFIALIGQPEPTPASATAEHRSIRVEIGEGLRFVLGDNRLRAIAAYVALANLWMTFVFAVLLLYFVHALHLGPATIGLIFGVGSVGGLAGAAAGERIPRRFGVGPTIVGSAIVGALPMLVIAVTPSDIAVPVVTAAWAVLGFGVVVNNVNQVSYRQTITPPALRGRMNASMQFINQSTIPIGAIAGGALGTVIGLQPTLLIGAIGLLLAFLPLAASPVRTVRSALVE